MKKPNRRLQELFDQFRDTPFLESSDSPKVAAVHAELASLDTHIAGIAHSTLTYGHATPIDLKRCMGTVASQVNELCHDADPQVKAAGFIYLDYFRRT